MGKAIVGAGCDFMEMMDITTHQAHDGVQAMALLQANRYDAIISDIRMPNMDGKRLFAEAVKLDPAYQTRFIFMSGDLIRRHHPSLRQNDHLSLSRQALRALPNA